MTTTENKTSTNKQLSTTPSVASILYFRPDFENRPDCQTVILSLKQLISTDIIIVTTWTDMVARIGCNIKLIVIHSSVIKEEVGAGLYTFMKMLNNMIQYMALSTDNPRVAVCIDDNVSVDFINKLKHENIIGIVPSALSYGTLETAKALDELSHNKEYWPAHIIDTLPSALAISKLPTLLYFIPDLVTHITPEIKQTLKSKVDCNIKFCSAWEELSSLLSDHPTSVLVHVSIFKHMNIGISEFTKMIQSLIYCVDQNIIVDLGVSINFDTTQEVVKELQDNGITCIIPGCIDSDMDELVFGINRFISTGEYIPTQIISKLPKSTTKTVKKGIHLTDRQQQVLSLVCNRGLSNKRIALLLKISESTVKIHISAILKEYGVRNRTQLALAASSSLKA